MHHRKQFWDYFSLLLGKDAKLYKIKENEFFTKYDDMIEFLLKKLVGVQYFFPFFFIFVPK